MSDAAGVETHQRGARLKIVVIGGVAGGANFATRARRLSEAAEIVLIERGPYVSFANCGMPYHIGGEIPSRDDLLLQTPESLAQTFGLDVRISHDAIRIDRHHKEVWIRNLATGETTAEQYDHLVLATGAVPVRPALPGIDLPGIFALRDMVDMDRINQWLARTDGRSAVIVGGGFVGLELAEQLQRRGIATTIIHSDDHLLTPFDVEMAAPIATELEKHGVRVVLDDAVAGFAHDPQGRIRVTTKQGRRHIGDIAILCMGVRPVSDLAANAGLATGLRHAVVVNEFLQTSDPNIWAVGDCVQLQHRVSGRDVYIPLAGPANRGGRLIADNILGRRRPFRGPMGTTIIRVFGLTAACTGLYERALIELDIPYQAVHLHPSSHAKYFPGSHPVAIKLLFDPLHGTIFGAQAVGQVGVDKRIDVIATAMAGGLTVEELGDLDLCYAPPFGSAKDAVNMAGLAASNIVDGLVEAISWHELPAFAGEATILDVRRQSEWDAGAIPDAMHIPLAELRVRMSEIPRNRPVIVYCHSGQRSYVACRLLAQHGYPCRNLSGAYVTWSAGQSSQVAVAQPGAAELLEFSLAR